MEEQWDIHAALGALFVVGDVGYVRYRAQRPISNALRWSWEVFPGWPAHGHSINVGILVLIFDYSPILTILM